MTDQEKEKLNMKLARWRWGNVQIYKPRAGKEIRVRIDGQTTQYDYFTDSLEGCFKWLVPKLQITGHFVTVGAFECSGYYAVVAKAFNCEPEQTRSEESPSLALCLAIEKIIDTEK